MTHIALALHDKLGTYWPYIVTTLTSVFANSSISLHVHILHDDTFTPQARQAIEQLCKKYGHQLTPHAMVLTPAMQKANVRHFSIAALYRLMLPQLLRNEELVIYLDADLIFNQIDIADLVQAIQSDPHQHPIAAVHDDLFTNNVSQRTELDMLGLSEMEYFNSGLLGLRPRRIDTDLVEALQKFIAQYPNATHIDQDLLNVTFRNRIHWLPERFNHQVNLAKGRYFEHLESFDRKILHYTGKAKPLSGTFAPPDIFFWRYTYEVPHIHQFIHAPMRYLQQMHDRPSAVYLISTQQSKP